MISKLNILLNGLLTRGISPLVNSKTQVCISKKQ